MHYFYWVEYRIQNTEYRMILMRYFISILLTVLTVHWLPGQELPAAYRAYIEKYPVAPALGRQDSLFLMNIAEKQVPEYLRSLTLPPVVDNSELPYLRPVFEQVAPSCGQAAMVGYNFTYEMACLRDQPAQFPQTQYPSHFVYNFQNGGNAWYGVSYFHSIEILRLCGTMNSFDYGDYYDDGKRWINGYNVYYNGMFNRVKGVKSIRTGTTEGINALKHWLHDHMGEQTHGGVASFYACPPYNAGFLNDTTPEGGKHVVFEFYPIASHAMTIVGYNDSIRWDYNNDGQYTNHIDLNNDGIIDPRDWEIGGVKFVNSHGVAAQDSGFCYIMYKCLSETFENGGIWNREVHILDIDPNYQPLMTYKVTLKHDYREKVKILAGISSDITDVAPEWIMDFPIIDYQGSDHFMQGNDDDEAQKSLQFGLDVTPLLSYIQPGEPARFFFMVDENDPMQEGTGQITAFSVMDYTDTRDEIVSTETPAMLQNNSRTIVSVVHSPEFGKVGVTTDALPPFIAGTPYSSQLTAAGGAAPYAWDPVYHYSMEQSNENFPDFHEIQVLNNATIDTIMPVALGFGFPYYGEIYDTVYMHINGHLQFDDAELPWPYMMEPVLHFRSNRIIAPMTHMRFTITPADGDGGWMDFTDSTATFRWKLSWMDNPGSSELNFAARIHKNGDIGFIYGSSTLQGIPWLGGISAGNKKDYANSPLSGAEMIQPGKKISYYYRPLPDIFDLSESGLITGQVNDDNFIYDLGVRVTDVSGISAVKSFELTSGPYLDFTVNAGGDEKVDYGDTVLLDVVVRNGSTMTLSNAVIELSTVDFFLDITDDFCDPGTLAPGQVVTIPQALSFIVSTEVPDHRDLLLNATLSSTEKTWNKELILKANAPDVRLNQVFVDDEDGRLDPGDTRPLMIPMQNNGHSAIDGLVATLYSMDPEVIILENPVQNYGTIGKGSSVTRPYMLQAQESTPNGFIAQLILSVNSTQGLQWQDTISLKIGKTPVLVVDMDPGFHSGPIILSRLHDLDVICEYDYTIPVHTENFQSIFVCLGFQNSNHILTLGDGTRLAGYLSNGGNLYMEGRKTWRDDPGTPIQPMFSLTTVSTVGVYDTINGLDGTFTQGLSLENEAATPFSFYYLEPAGNAFSILQDNSSLQSCAIAYDEGSYKTIGALFELGTMSGIPPTSKWDLLIAYLEFFGIDYEPVGVEEAWGHGGMGAWRLWPNPVSSQLTVGSWQSAVSGLRSAVSGRRSPVGFSIYDLFGRNVLEIGNITSFPYTFDISGLSPGMYLLRIVEEDGLETSLKFLKVSR
jgi:hypothetical protein